MSPVDTERLAQLRKKIIQSVVPLADTGTLDPQDRFELLIRLAEVQPSVDLYEKAFQLALEFEDENKLDALMTLLGDVDTTLDDNASDAEGDEGVPPVGNQDGVIDNASQDAPEEETTP